MDEFLEFLIDHYPIFATEFGSEDSPNNRENIVNYLEDRNISWTTWSFSKQYGPRMLQNVTGTFNGSSWEMTYTPNEGGVFFRTVLQNLKNECGIRPCE